MPSTKYFIKKDLIIGIFVLLFACGFGALLFFKVLDYSGSGEQVWMIFMLFVLFVIGVTVIVRSIVKLASYKKILSQCVMAEGKYAGFEKTGLTTFTKYIFLKCDVFIDVENNGLTKRLILKNYPLRCVSGLPTGSIVKIAYVPGKNIVIKL